MQKFQVVKKLSLDFLGGNWKDCFIDFNSLTIADVRTKFPAISSISGENKEEIDKGVNTVLEIVKDKFISGKAVGANGELVDLKVEDIDDLPIEVLSRALDFLSQGVTGNSPKQ